MEKPNYRHLFDFWANLNLTVLWSNDINIQQHEYYYIYLDYNIIEHNTTFKHL